MTTTEKPAYEADIEPEMLTPRLRLNFTNGRTASVLLRRFGLSATKFWGASLATMEDGKPTLLGPTEASPEETAVYLAFTAVAGDHTGGTTDEFVNVETARHVIAAGLEKLGLLPATAEAFAAPDDEPLSLAEEFALGAVANMIARAIYAAEGHGEPPVNEEGPACE